MRVRGMLNQFKATITDGSHSNDRNVSWSIVLVKQHTFTEFHTELDLNIFVYSTLPQK